MSHNIPEPSADRSTSLPNGVPVLNGLADDLTRPTSIMETGSPRSESLRDDPVNLIGSSLDEVRDSEGWLRQLTGVMPQIVWTASSDGSVDYFNSRWYEYTGMSPEASLCLGWRDAVHPDDVGRFSSERDRGLGDGDVFQVEIRLRRRDGEYRWHLVRSAPLKDQVGRVSRRSGTATDIDDRKRAEEALQDSEERFVRFMQHLPGLAWIKDAQGRYIYANEAPPRRPRRQHQLAGN